jgi:hypothetical protein
MEFKENNFSKFGGCNWWQTKILPSGSFSVNA